MKIKSLVTTLMIMMVSMLTAIQVNAATCTCTLETTKNFDTGMDAGYGFAVKLTEEHLRDILEITYQTNGCTVHSGYSDRTFYKLSEFTSYDISSQYGNGCWVEDDMIYMPSSATSDFTVTHMTYTLNYNGLTNSSTVQYQITREIGEPQITKVEYIPPSDMIGNDTLNITINPNGCSSAEMYFNGDFKTMVYFDCLSGTYQPKTLTYHGIMEEYNHYAPKGVSNFKVQRDYTNPQYILFSWKNENPTNCQLSISTYNEEVGDMGGSIDGWSSGTADITAVHSTRIVYINGEELIPDNLEYVAETYTGKKVIEVPWDATITVETIDSTLISTYQDFDMDNSYLYMTKPVTDTASVIGNEIVVDIRDNDIMDNIYAPELIGQYTLMSGPNGTVVDVSDASEFGNLASGMSGQVMYIRVPRGYTGEVSVEYLYEPPRYDMPEVELPYANVYVSFQGNEEPVINSYMYDVTNDKLTIKVDPKGRQSISLYVKDILITQLTFDADDSGNYAPKEFQLTSALSGKSINTAPRTVKNINIKRDDNDISLINITWSDGIDIDEQVTMYVVGTDNMRSDSESFNIKSDTTNKYVEMYSPDDILINTYCVEANSANVQFNDAKYYGYIKVYSKDTIDGISGITTLNIPNKVVYNTTIVDDNVVITEGESKIVDVQLNDTHDIMFDVPVISNYYLEQVKVGNGAWTDYNNSKYLSVSIQEPDEDNTSASLLSITANNNTTGGAKIYVKVKYEYAAVRTDIQPAYGYCTVEIEPANQAPVAKAVSIKNGENIINGEVYNIRCMAGEDILIPVKILIASSSDKEGDAISLYDIGDYYNYTSSNTNYRIDILTARSNSQQANNLIRWNYVYDAGNIGYIPSNISGDGEEYIKIINQSNGNKYIRYRVYDGEKTSNWSYFIVNVEKPEDPPVAEDAQQVNMPLTTAKLKYKPEIKYSGKYNLNAEITSVQVKHLESADYENVDNFKVNIKAESEAPTGGNGLKVPFFTVERNISDEAIIWSVGDIIKVEYKVTAETVNNTDTGIMYINIIEGDDTNSNEGYLYVHRKPTGIFSMGINMDDSGYLSTTNTPYVSSETSYDIDHTINNVIRGNIDITDAGISLNGIRAWEWEIIQVGTSFRWKRVFETNGIVIDNTEEISYLKDTTNGILKEQYGNNVNILTTNDAYITDLSISSTDVYISNNVATTKASGIAWVNDLMYEIINYDDFNTYGYIVKLRVRDVDGPNTMGEWSDAISSVMQSGKLAPIAKFITEKALYIIPENTNDFTLGITDLSQDPNGDEIVNWKWTLESPKGESVIYEGDEQDKNSDIASQILTWFKSYETQGLPESAKYKITLEVTDATNLVSEPYSVEVQVYKDNQAPVIEGGSMTSISDYRLYIADDGLDGVVGDSYGTLKSDGSGYANLIHFFPTVNGVTVNKFVTITDDQDINNLTLSYTFEGQSVPYLNRYVEGNEADIIKSYGNKKYNDIPFNTTVTDEGFTPGIYKVTVSAIDNPSGILYEGSEAKLSTMSTSASSSPYHISVIPKLYLFPYVEYNGYKFTRYGVLKPGAEYNSKDSKDMVSEADIMDIAPSIGDQVKVCVAFDKPAGNETPVININGTSYSSTTYSPLNRFTYDNKYLNYVYYTIPDTVDGDADLVSLPVNVTLSTRYGSASANVTTRTKTNSCEFKVLPIKLSDFRVVKLTDPAIADELQDKIDSLKTSSFKLSTGSLVDGIPVSNLAIDNETVSNGQLMVKGYSFYFKINSKGLKANTDNIRITPSFYSVTTDDSGKVTGIGSELYGYLPNEAGEYKRYTGTGADTTVNNLYPLYYEGDKINSLGNHNTVTLNRDLMTTNGNIQTWSGRYGIPVDAKFSTSSASLTNEYKGKILIAFKIDAMKNGVAKYNYVERGQWQNERISGLKTLYSNIESTSAWKSTKMIGSVLVFNGEKSAADAYMSNPVWRE